jgi:hypothetical protein
MSDGIERVYLNDHRQFHRDDGPAVVYANIDMTWYFNGKIHRLDGPAVMWPGMAGGIFEWHINGFYVDQKIKAWARERDIDLNNLSELDKAVIAMEWSNYEG